MTLESHLQLSLMQKMKCDLDCRFPRSRIPRIFESAIVNLKNKDGPSTHWVAYKTVENNVEYFDSFGNLRPPLNLVEYLSVDRIKYNHDRYQNYNTFVCGHLCLKFLCNQLKLKNLYSLYK